MSAQVWAQEDARPGEEREAFCWCPPGKFLMGTPKEERRWSDREDETQHEVTLTRGFWIGKYEVTQAQWQALMRSNPSDDKGPENPVEGVSWKLLKTFLKKMGKGYRLPTEAEWEYACRAGSATRFCFVDDEERRGVYAWWYEKNCAFNPHPVGQKKPNAWGIHDMHGNVWEWCADWFADYPQGPVIDPRGHAAGERGVLRVALGSVLPEIVAA